VAGRLYTWATAIDSAKLYREKSIDCGYGKTCTLLDTVYGVCPPGWHLPTQAEWTVLFSVLGGQSTAGLVLKSLTGWSSNGNGTDAFGFSALPAGRRNDDGSFRSDGINVNFWSASEDSSYYAYNMTLRYNYEVAYLNFNDKNYGFSVRCLRD